jgi:hypothetical protein
MGMTRPRLPLVMHLSLLPAPSSLSLFPSSLLPASSSSCPPPPFPFSFLTPNLTHSLNLTLSPSLFIQETKREECGNQE